MAFYSKYVLITEDPGFLPKVDQNSKKEESEASVDVVSEPEDKSKTDTCKTCKIDRLNYKLTDDIDTTGALISFNQNHHCSICNHCTFYKDHHCLFVCYCIGYRTLKPFILFTFYMGVTCFITIWLLLIGFYTNDPNEGLVSVFEACFHKIYFIEHYKTAWTVFCVIVG